MANDPLNRAWGKKSIHLQKPDWSSLEQLMHAPIYIVQPIPGAGIEYVDQEVEKLVKSLGKVGLIVIDGIDHINIWANGHYRAENPGASWAEVSAKVKWMALTCRCPVIADTRIVNSNPDEGAMPNPTIWDLPYQGALANSADLICLLDGFSYLRHGSLFRLRTSFSRNGLYAWVDLIDDQVSGRVFERQ